MSHLPPTPLTEAKKNDRTSSLARRILAPTKGIICNQSSRESIGARATSREAVTVSLSLTEGRESIADRPRYAWRRGAFPPVSSGPGSGALGVTSWKHVYEHITVTTRVLCPDMRKALSRDPGKKSMVPLKHPVRPDQLD